MTRVSVKHIPNIITSCRIIGSITLGLLSIENSAFWIIYILCGVSDMVDGTIARRLHAESKTGAMLDSIADLIMVIICGWKFIPLISTLPYWIWIWIGVIALIKIINVISSLVILRSVVFPHTIANKVTGFVIFALFPFLFFCWSIVFPVTSCIIATFAAVQEGHYIRTGRVE